MLFSSDAIEARKQRAAARLNEILKNEDCVLIFSGEPIQKPGGLDQNYPFNPHPAYFWLTGRRRASEVVFYSKRSGWIEFRKPIGHDEALWEGGVVVAEEGHTISKFYEFLERSDFHRVFAQGQVPTDGKFVDARDRDLYEVKKALDQTRRVKDAEEIQLIEKLAVMANQGYLKLRDFISPGVTEREIQIAFESETFRAGSQRVPYESIVGSGANSAVLHAIPTHKKIQAGEMVLVDAGTDIDDYCTDVTRVFAADGKFTSRQQELYDLVLNAQLKGIEVARAGVQWSFVHETTARVIADGLKHLKILEGTVDSLIETGAISVFYPHGVGHLVGLRVRDTGCEENLEPKKYCGVRLRVDMPLVAGVVMTVEPGCYFVKALINDTKVQETYGKLVRWEEASRWLDFGGVRLEDNILITEGEPRVLTGMIQK